MKSIEKTNYKFAAAPIVLLPITTANEFKIITYLSNIAYITDNITVSVSLTHICKALRISKQTLITNLNSLITLNLISRVSGNGNGNTNNSYTINFDYIKFDYINEFGDEQTIDLPIK